jgi:hypothetical protein
MGGADLGDEDAVEGARDVEGSGAFEGEGVSGW